MMAGSAIPAPFVHRLTDQDVHLLVVPMHGQLALNILHWRGMADKGPLITGFQRWEDALKRGLDYVREAEPGHDCQAKGCYFGV